MNSWKTTSKTLPSARILMNTTSMIWLNVSSLDEDFASEDQVILATNPTLNADGTIGALFYVTSLPGNGLCGDASELRRKRQASECLQLILNY